MSHQLGAIVLSIALDPDPETGAAQLVDTLAAIDPTSVPRLAGGGTAGGVRLVTEPYSSTLIRWLDSSEAPAPILGAHGRVLRDVTVERLRQIEKGYTAEHDDAHGDGDLVGYALDRVMIPDRSSNRATLVEVTAMLVAEIERLDRAAARDD